MSNPSDFIQAVAGTTATGSSAATVVINAAQNNVLICAMVGNNGIDTSAYTISDNGGTPLTWTSRVDNENGYRLRVWTSNANPNASGNITISVTPDAGHPANKAIIVYESYQPDSAIVDGTAVASTFTTSNPGNTVTFSTPSQSFTNDLSLVFLVCAASPFPAITAAATGYTAPAGGKYDDGTYQIYSEYKQTTTSGTQTGGWTDTTVVDRTITYGAVTIKGSNSASSGGVHFNSSLNGLGASGPFFHDRLAA